MGFSEAATTNPYTGEVTETSPGMYLQNGTVDVTIKNRPFTPYVDKNGNYVNVYYTFFMRQNGPFDDWSEYISSVHGPWYAVYQQSDSEYTVITFTYGASGPDPFFHVAFLGEIWSFYVQAVTGYFYRDENIGAGYFNSVYEGEGSLWSQFTITIPVSDKPVTSTSIAPSRPGTSSSSNPNPSQSTPQQALALFDMVIVRIFVALCIIVVLMATTAFLFKQRKTNLHQTKTNRCD